MPSAYDPRARQLPITHNPVQRIPLETGKLPPFDPSVIFASVLDQLVEVIKDATGIDLTEFLSVFDQLSLDFSSPQAFVASLVHAITAIPEVISSLLTELIAILLTLPEMLGDLVMKLVEQLAALTGIDLTEFLSVLNDIELDFSGPSAFLHSLANALITITNAFIGPDSPLNALNLFNLVPQELLSNFSISAIGDTVNNLLANPHFENLDSVASSVWTWDPSQHHTLIGGSAKVTADGTGKDLLSNLVPVAKDQVLDVSAWVKYSGLTGSGTPIQLGITTYLKGSPVGQPVIATKGLTPPTSDWLKLSGTYTVPANVDSARLRLTVASTATAGTIWWDDTNLSKTGNLLQRLIQGTNPGETMTNDIEHLFGGIMTNANNILNRALQGDLTALQQALDPTGTLTAIEDRINSFLHSLSPLNGSNISHGSIGNGFLPGLLTEIDNAVRGLFNIPGNGFSQDDSANAYSHVADTLAGMQSRLTQLYTERTTGRSFFDDFERSASSLGPNWSVTYPTGSGGTIRTDGHNAVWDKSGTSKRLYVARYTPNVTATDDQIIITSLNSKADRPLILGLSENPGYNCVNGRMSADNLNYVEFRIGCGEAWLYAVINGVYSEMAHTNYSGSDPAAGSALTLQCIGNYFEARHNAKTVIAVTSTSPSKGTSFRGVGHGGVAGHGTLYQLVPGEMRAWTGADAA